MGVTGMSCLLTVLRYCHQMFCSFGGGTDLTAIDNVKFAKLMRECELLSSKFTATDVDLVFTQVCVIT